MLILASLGSWLPFAIIGLVRQYLFSVLRFDSVLLVHHRLFVSIYSSISTKTPTRLSCHLCLFNLVNYCTFYIMSSTNRCYVGFIYEISKWNIQSTNDLSSDQKWRKRFFLKEWTANQTTRDHIQKYVEIGYYILYSLVIAMAFLINPFLFFYYEDKQEEDRYFASVRLKIKRWEKGDDAFLVFPLSVFNQL